MRWKIGVLSCIACLTFGTGTSRAETNWVGIYGGFAFPTGDLGDFADTGWDIGATGTWMFTPMLGAGVDVAYLSWSGQDDAALLGDLSFSAVQATAHAMLMFQTGSSFHPYLKAGLGAYNFDQQLESAGPGIDFDESETNFGFNLGGGINLATTSNIGWGASATWHSIQEDPDTVDFFTVNLNLTFGVGGPQ